MSHENPIRVVTYNIGGARKDFGSDISEILETIRKLSPDILGLQECTEWCDADNNKHSFGRQIAEALGHDQNYYFGKTLSLQENLQVKKAVMLFSIYNDWEDWEQGNALYAKHGFERLGSSGIPGHPRNIPLYRPPTYEGTRDTDPRYAIVARVKCPNASLYVVCTHLTTLLGERGGEIREIPGKSSEAQMLRFHQAKSLLDLLKPILNKNEIIILMGDFNASYKEACISSVLEGEGGFLRIIPKNDISTHPKAHNAVDHILIYPKDRMVDYSCWIVDSDIAKVASDHLPVVADIVFK
jgi:endonuclease/exonuclease/phosphatase family metal-dependent hydrolase